MSEADRKVTPGYEKDGKWYCYTWNSLDNLGAVLNAVTLTLQGTTKVGYDENGNATGNPEEDGIGHVYGGGDASAVNNTTNPANASTTVTLKGETTILGNVFGGGNKGIVSGSATVNIKD